MEEDSQNLKLPEASAIKFLKGFDFEWTSDGGLLVYSNNPEEQKLLLLILSSLDHHIEPENTEKYCSQNLIKIPHAKLLIEKLEARNRILVNGDSSDLMQSIRNAVQNKARIWYQSGNGIHDFNELQIAGLSKEDAEIIKNDIFNAGVRIRYTTGTYNYDQSIDCHFIESEAYGHPTFRIRLFHNSAKRIGERMAQNSIPFEGDSRFLQQDGYLR